MSIPIAYMDDEVATIRSLHPKATLCLNTAATIHELTLDNPHFVNVTVPDDAEVDNRQKRLRIAVHRFPAETFDLAVIDVPTIDSDTVRVTDADRTVLDLITHRINADPAVAYEAHRKPQPGWPPPPASTSK